jgi:hypothetical protein
MEPPISPLLYAVLLFLGMLTLLEVGRRLGVWRRPKESEGERGSVGTVEGAVFALFGLMVAFTFSGAATRFNEKRMLIAEEVNTIETAYLRLHLVPQEAQSALQELFRQYLDSRLELIASCQIWRQPSGNGQIQEAPGRDLGWRQWPLHYSRKSHPDAGKLWLPALNDMIDITTTRSMALQTHPPESSMRFCSVMGLICSLLAGYRMSSAQHRSWLHILGLHGHNGHHRVRDARR